MNYGYVPDRQRLRTPLCSPPAGSMTQPDRYPSTSEVLEDPGVLRNSLRTPKTNTGLR